MEKVPGTIVCNGCDAVYAKPELRRREVMRCTRCGSELDRHSGEQRRRILPLTVASLIMFAIANLFPIVEIELQGLTSQTTLIGAVRVLSGENMSLVALLVLMTTVLFPLLQLCILLWLPGAAVAQAPGAGLRAPGAGHAVAQALGNDRGVSAGRAGRDRQAIEHGDGGARRGALCLRGAHGAADGGAGVRPARLLGSGLRRPPGAATA